MAPSGLVWALTWLGSALVRLGVSLTDPSGTHWAEVAALGPDSPLTVLGVGGAGVWTAARGGGVWLRQGVRSDCTGSGQKDYFPEDLKLNLNFIQARRVNSWPGAPSGSRWWGSWGWSVWAGVTR